MITDGDVEKYYIQYGPMVLRRCRSMLNNEESAFDAMQDVFVKVLMNRKTLRDEYPSSLLYRIATTTCLNILRRNVSIAVRQDSPVFADLKYADDVNGSLVERDYIEYLLREEKPSTRNLIHLRYIEKRPYGELSQLTGLSISGIRKRLRMFKKRIESIKKGIHHRDVSS